MAEKKSKKSQTGAKQTGKKLTQKKELFDVSFYHAWCKACGICMAFCPKGIIKAGKTGQPEITSQEDQDKCFGCRFCEIHCPDFAITVTQRNLKRRENDV